MSIVSINKGNKGPSGEYASSQRQGFASSSAPQTLDKIS